MSVNDLDEAFRLIEKNFDESDIYKGTSKNQHCINEISEILKIRLPETYIQFLKKLGFIRIGYLFIPGIFDDEDLKNSGLGWSVINDRDDLNFPHYLVNIHEIGNGDTYCLDTSQMNEKGECPVVVWPIGGYEQTPILEIVAEDFGAFFLDMVRQQIAYKNSTT